MKTEGDEDMTSLNENIEKTARSHSGILAIVQTVIGGLILFTATKFYDVAQKNNDATNDQARSLFEVKGQVTGISGQVAAVQLQLQGFSSISVTQAEQKVKLAELERRVTELEQAKKLK